MLSVVSWIGLDKAWSRNFIMSVSVTVYLVEVASGTFADPGVVPPQEATTEHVCS